MAYLSLVARLLLNTTTERSGDRECKTSVLQAVSAKLSAKVNAKLKLCTPNTKRYTSSNLAVKCRSTGAWYTKRNPLIFSRSLYSLAMDSATYTMCWVV